LKAIDDPDGAARKVFTRLALHIDGAWLTAQEGVGEKVLDPATGAALGWLPHASAAQLQQALQAAHQGFTLWSATPAFERRRVLLEAARLLRERGEVLARVLTLEQGKPLAESRAEWTAAIEIIEWYAEEARRLYGRTIPARTAQVVQVVQQQALGPVAAFTPWNFPALTPARKIAGALAAGCSLTIKPAEETPATAMALVQACVDAGLPAGVLQLVFGVPAQVSETLIQSPLIRKISFTGSIPVGKHLAESAARHGVKRCTLELGGHAPVLVFDDADVERAAQLCAAGRFRNAGQVCVAPSRFYVQRAAVGRFAQALGAAAEALTVGNGLDPQTTMGPMINARRLAAMQHFVDDAQRGGARILCGGTRLQQPGFFFAPTVVQDLRDDAAMLREEIFGPIAPIVAFDTAEEALARANALPFGLAAYAFTGASVTADKVAQGLEAGMVAINHLAVSIAEAPFGGVKESGYGSEGGVEGLQAYLTPKFVTRMAV